MKSKNSLFPLIILLIPILFSGTCKRDDESCHHRITINNNADEDVFFQVGLIYPDTTLSDNDNPLPAGNYYKCLANSFAVDFTSSCWESYFYNAPSDTLMIFIFDSNILETVPWDTVCANYMILKRYDLSLKDLQNTNWTITYP